MKHSKLVIANWKMNPETYKEAVRIFTSIKKTASRTKKTHTVVCPSFIHIKSLASQYRGKKVSFGAQDVFYETCGAHTGEVSPTQLKDSGCSFVIVGHSERRAKGETVPLSKKKVLKALAYDFNVVICLGEKERDHHGEYLSYIRKYLLGIFDGVAKKDISRVVIAYEPIWAIGKGAKDAMSAHEMHQMSLYIKKVMSELYSKKVADSIPIIYGGSVKEDNAQDLIENGHIQGFLVGSASLDPDEFSGIISHVENHSSKD